MLSEETIELLHNDFGSHGRRLSQGIMRSSETPLPSDELVDALTADAARAGISQPVDWSMIMAKVLPLAASQGVKMARMIGAIITAFADSIDPDATIRPAGPTPGEEDFA
jgi:hypothetical protein